MIEDVLPPRQEEMILRSFFTGMFALHRNLSRKSRNAEGIGLLKWCRYYLGRHLVKPPSKMHKRLCELLDMSRSHGGLKINILAPRGAAKSTLGTLGFPLREAIECREPYIWIISDTMSQAHSHLENIKSELQDNRTLALRYPDAAGKGPVWRGGSILMNNGVMIEAFGTGQGLRGRRLKQYRPTLIVCDDLQNDNHILSSYARDKSRSWFHGTLLKAGNSDTTVLNLATALHTDAIAVELHGKPGWISERFQAIEQWPDNMSLWEKWE